MLYPLGNLSMLLVRAERFYGTDSTDLRVFSITGLSWIWLVELAN